MRKKIPEALINLLGLEDIKATCLKKKYCDEGVCDAAISQEGDTFKLVTGIVPSPDFLGSRRFHLDGIKRVLGKAIIVTTTEGDSMRLEPRT